MTVLTTTAVAASVSACLPSPTRPDTAPAIERVERQAAASLPVVPREIARPAVRVSDASYIGGQLAERPRSASLPAVFLEPITLVESGMTINDIARAINQTTGLSVRPPPPEHVTSDLASGAPSTGDSRPASMNVQYAGSLKGLLDSVAAYFGGAWEYRDGLIVIAYQQTRTFTLASPLGAYNMAGMVGGASSGEGSSTNQSTSIGYELDPWDDVVANIKSILSDKGKVVAGRAAGILVVTDSPSVLDRVATYMHSINQAMSRQISVNVKVLAVGSSNEHAGGLDLDLAFKTLTGEYGLGIASAAPLAIGAAAGEFTAAVIEPPPSGASSGSRKFAGTHALISALRSQGKVSLITSGSGITLNNRPLPIVNVNQRGYLKASKTTTTTDVGVSTELTPGEITTGFTMTVTPHVMDNGNVILHYIVQMSDLNSIDTIQSGDQSLQLTNTSKKEFSQYVSVRPGSTIVLAGFQEARDSYDRANALLGYSAKDEKARTMVVILIAVNSVGGVSL